MEKVTDFKFWCQKVIPLVYDESLSYYETLCKVSSKLNEVIKYTESYSDEFYKYVDNQVGSLSNELNGKIDSIIGNVIDITNNTLDILNQNIAKINKDMETLKNYVDNEILNQQSWVINQVVLITKSINIQINELKNYVISEDNSLYSYIDVEIRKVIDLIPEITSVIIKNPITGKNEPIQAVIDYLTKLFLYNAFNCKEFDNMFYSAETFDNFNITAYEFDTTGKEQIGINSKLIMRDPTTGNNVLYKDVIYWLISLHKENAQTTTELDGLNYNATYIDNLSYTAYYVDFNGLKTT